MAPCPLMGIRGLPAREKKMRTRSMLKILASDTLTSRPLRGRRSDEKNRKQIQTSLELAGMEYRGWGTLGDWTGEMRELKATPPPRQDERRQHQQHLLAPRAVATPNQEGGVFYYTKKHSGER